MISPATDDLSLPTTAALPGQTDATPKDVDAGSYASPPDPGIAQTTGEPAMAVDGGGSEDTGHGAVKAGAETGQTLQSQNEGEKPAWSELKTKAGKERKRLPLACIACRRKKIRCSGERPACRHCSRSRVPCVYKVTTRKAAPRTDYMAMLDKRLKRMEERVIKAIPKDENRDMAAIGRSVVKPTVSGQTSSRSQKKRSAEEAFAFEIEQWPAGGGDATMDTFPMSHGSKSGEGTTTCLMKAGAEFLPSLEIQEHLAEVFFDCVYGQSYLLLHKPSFMRRLKAGTVPPVLILAVCAVSARFSTHPLLNSEPPFLRGQNWAEPAATIALSRHDEPNLTILTVFLLLGLHDFGTCHGGRSWSFGGQAIRMAYALQLHRELDCDPLPAQRNTNGSQQLSFTDREIRRRIMWGCFMMDRFNSSGSRRPPMGNETFLQIQLPIKESRFQMEIPGPTEDLDGHIPNPIPEHVGQLSNARENMGVAAYVIRATALWGRIVDYLNLGGMKRDPYPLWSPESGYTRLKRQIEEFSASLPSSLTFTYENLQIHAAEKVANQFLFLHIIAHQNMLFLNQFGIPLSPRVRPPKDMPKNFLSDAGRAAVEAAHHISNLINYASSYNLTAPFAGYCAYSASTVHIWGIFSKNAQLEARSKENLRHTYRYLNKMKRYWGMFHYMVQSAKDRYRHFADAALKGSVATSTTQQNGQLTPMLQYSDWFDRYPNGVSKLHWEDPDNTKDKERVADDAVMGQKPDLQSVENFFAGLSSSSSSSSTTTPSSRHTRKRPQLHSRKTSIQSSPSPGTIICFNQSTTNPHPVPGTTTIANTPGIMETAPASTPVFPQPSTATITTTTTTLFPQNHHHNHTGDFHFDQFSFNFTLADQLPQLDRQFVYDEAFTGLDLAFDTAVNNNPHGNPNLHSVDSPGTSSLWTTGTGNGVDDFHPTEPSGTGELYQPSAWFLPFNLDPGCGETGAGNLDLNAHADLNWH